MVCERAIQGIIADIIKICYNPMCMHARMHKQVCVLAVLISNNYCK